MSPPRRYKWILVGPGPDLASCQRCGARLDMPPMPQSIPAVLAYVKGFIAVHRGCEMKGEGV